MADAAPQQPPVLVVDDDKNFLRFVAALLKKDNIPFVESDTGFAAFTYLQKQLELVGKPGVVGIVSDWKMPGWDGLKLLSEIRKHPGLKEIPFILMSGAVTKAQLEVAAKGGPEGVLLKPFEREVFIAKVRSTFFK